MLLLAGLGNPGREHKLNRHNVGFMAVDEIVHRHGFSPWRKRFRGEVAEGTIAGHKVIALKPLTYMNESGVSVGEAAHFYKINGSHVLVAHDELDLAPGKIRVKMGGGHAGHNGLRSIDAHFGQGYRRLRIGIGHPGRERVLGYVLQDFTKAEFEWLNPLIDAMAEAAPFIAKGDDPGFMTKVALLTRAPADEPDVSKEKK